MDTPSYNQNKTSVSNNYSSIRRQAAKDKKSLEVYEKWTSEMNDSQRQELKELGLEKLKITYSAKGGPKQDAAESNAASYEPDYAAIIDGEEESGIEQPIKLDAVDAVRHLIAELMTHGNPRLTLECLALVFGLWGNLGDSLTDIGNRYGVSPQAVSERCIALCKKFGTPVPGGMHSKKAKNSTKPGKKRKK